MDWDRLSVSIVGILLGFLLSQSINFFSFLRRPKLAISNAGIIGGYSGGDDEPACAYVGFDLTNKGYQPATDIRVFVTPLSASFSDGTKRETLASTFEIESRTKLIPPNSQLLIEIGKFSADTKCLRLYVKEKAINNEYCDILEGDTFNACGFKLKIFIFDSDTRASTTSRLDADLRKEKMDGDLSYFDLINTEVLGSYRT